jgi:hypothetical protein
MSFENYTKMIGFILMQNGDLTRNELFKHLNECYNIDTHDEQVKKDITTCITNNILDEIYSFTKENKIKLLTPPTLIYDNRHKSTKMNKKSKKNKEEKIFMIMIAVPWWSDPMEKIITYHVKAVDKRSALQKCLKQNYSIESDGDDPKDILQILVSIGNDYLDSSMLKHSHCVAHKTLLKKYKKLNIEDYEENEEDEIKYQKFYDDNIENIINIIMGYEEGNSYSLPTLKIEEIIVI